jgi:hypothetical protein
MFLGVLTLITALTISAIAIYYSVAGLVAIFAAAAIPITIMGGSLEIGKLVAAVWLHKYWKQSPKLLKFYLTLAVAVLMFITSMGIFGFLSKAHIEQTASAQEGIAQIERIETEIARQNAIIERSEQRISVAEESVSRNNNDIQLQIDREQERIESAYDRIQPAIQEQTNIINDARLADDNRIGPFNDQLRGLEQELARLETQVNQYEERIATLSIDTSAADPLLAQIDSIESSISLVQGQLAGGEREAIQAAQRTIGVDDDGAAGPNTRRAADAWITQQQQRIAQLQVQIVELRQSAGNTVETERQRLTQLVNEIENERMPAIRQRQLEVLATIDEVRATESPVIQAARDEIQRLRASADAQVAQSQALIQSLRESITIGDDPEVAATIEEQQQRIAEASVIIDDLTEQRYVLEAQYRALEAEVGPVKYLAEFVYGETADKDLLEEAVRWVIIIIIFVFDPLAVVLLLASQKTFEWHREQKLAKTSTATQTEQPSEVSITITEESPVIVEEEPAPTFTRKFSKKNRSSAKPVEPDNKKVDTVVYDPYTDNRTDKELTKTELQIRKEIWPPGYDGKLAPPKPFDEEK